MGEITTLIRAARRGDREALDRLFSLLYDDLHRIAHARVHAGGPNTLLDTTGLVHETYARLGVEVDRLRALVMREVRPAVAEQLLLDERERDAMRQALAEVRGRLGSGGASRRAALEVADLLRGEAAA